MATDMLIVDTGSLLRFIYLELPSSKKKLIELLYDYFQLFAPEEVFKEMEIPKESLQDIWDDIRLSWDIAKNKIIKCDPPRECFEYIVDRLKKSPPKKEKAEYKAIALALYLSRKKRQPVLVSTHERKALSMFNYICKVEQIGMTVSPFDILTLLHVYKDISYDDIDSLWKQLFDFPGTVLEFHFRQISYEEFKDCLLKCQNRICGH